MDGFERKTERLQQCYWFSVEFGLCKEGNERKAYGAGLLSSFGELEYCMTDKPEIRPWNPSQAAQQTYPITTYQPIYYLADSFQDAKKKMVQFTETFSRPFHLRYNDAKRSVEVDRDVALDKPPSKKN